MQENPGNKLSYTGDEDGYSIYLMWLGGRGVFYAKASKDEEGMPIYIRTVYGDSWMKTTSRAFAKDDGSRISAMTMKEAVYGNLPWLMADLIIPKS